LLPAWQVPSRRLVPTPFIHSLRKLPASAYPVTSDSVSQANHQGNDWYQKQKEKTMIKEPKALTTTVVNW
jgi:hypothetical protein